MTRDFATRATAGIVSTAFALSLTAPVASAGPLHLASARPTAAALTASVPAAASGRGVADPGYAATSRAIPDPCNPFSWTLQICAEGASYSMPNASSTSSARPTPVRVVAHSSGFDWGEAAAIGAATLVLVGIGVGGIRAAANNGSRRAATN